MRQKRTEVLKSYSAEVVLVTKEQGGFLVEMKMVGELKASQPNIFLP